MMTPARQAALPAPAPLITGSPDPHTVTEEIARPVEKGPGRNWWMLFALASSIMTLGLVLIGYTIATGIGVWGNNRSVGWGFAITNFVFWVGIGHAGTLISAILLLLRARWRTSIARAAEAMTIFAVMCAGLFPIIHMGRPWLAFWVFPYPNSRGSLWQNYRSPLEWDVFAISTYFMVSAIFWFVGLIPDLATLRDRMKPGLRRRIYGFLSFGWNGSSRTWQRYEKVSLLLAGLATPLVVSVHTIVSYDFTAGIVPGWHSTIFPPYFVAGAVFSGFAMVITLLVITRKALHLERYITLRHLELMSKVLLTTGLLVGFAYTTEIFMAWYSGNPTERFTFMNRAFGPYAWAYWLMVSCNVLVPQIFWFKRCRTSVPILFVASLLVNVGMWFERFNIVVTSLHRSYLPSSWSYYRPTLVEGGILLGTFGLFFTCYLLFVRFAPVVSFHEVKHTVEQDRHATLEGHHA